MLKSSFLLGETGCRLALLVEPLLLAALVDGTFDVRGEESVAVGVLLT